MKCDVRLCQQTGEGRAQKLADSVSGDPHRRHVTLIGPRDIVESELFIEILEVFHHIRPRIVPAGPPEFYRRQVEQVINCELNSVYAAEKEFHFSPEEEFHLLIVIVVPDEFHEPLLSDLISSVQGWAILRWKPQEGRV